MAYPRIFPEQEIFITLTNEGVENLVWLRACVDFCRFDYGCDESGRVRVNAITRTLSKSHSHRIINFETNRGGKLLNAAFSDQLCYFAARKQFYGKNIVSSIFHYPTSSIQYCYTRQKDFYNICTIL